MVNFSENQRAILLYTLSEAWKLLHNLDRNTKVHEQKFIDGNWHLKKIDELECVESVEKHLGTICILQNLHLKSGGYCKAWLPQVSFGD